MKKLFLLLALIPVLLNSCSDSTDTTTYVGNWALSTQFKGSPRCGSVIFKIQDTVYIIGGRYYENKDFIYRDVYAYVPKSQSWYRKDDFKGYLRTGAIGFSIGNKGYYGLGKAGDIKDNDSISFQKLKDFWEFDPTQPKDKQWKQLTDFQGTARVGAIGFSAKGFGYVITGYDSENKYLSDTWQFNPATGSWNELQGEQAFPGDKRYNGNYFELDGRIYVCTGRSNSGYVKDLWAFNADSMVWSKKRKIDNNSSESFDDLYTSIVGESCCAFSMNGKGYISLGKYSSYKSNTWEYDPKTDLWTQKTSFEKGGRSEAVAFSYTDGNNIDHGFVLTGTNGNSSTGFFDDVFEFFPTAEVNAYDND